MGNSSRKSDCQIKIAEITPQSLMNSQLEAEVATIVNTIIIIVHQFLCCFLKIKIDFFHSFLQQELSLIEQMKVCDTGIV